MLELDFNIFWDRIKLDQKVNKRYGTVHSYEDTERFIFIYKSTEFWDYFTVVEMSDILQFATDMELTEDEAIRQFKINYISNTVPLKSSEFNDIKPRLLNKISKNITEIIEPGKDVVDESEDYEAFMIRILKQMEKKVVAAISNIPIEKSINLEKTFGEFLNQLMNSVNLLPFIKKVRVFVKRGLVAGMGSAEEEVGIDIGFTEAFREKLTSLSNQQLTGYTMPDGKMWHGIKGASKDLQIDILKTVQEDVINKVPRKDMIKNVQEVFEGSGFNQAARIARTESQRFLMEGKLTGYIESGIPGKKAYAAVMDNKTSDICRRLHIKYFKNGIPFDEPFVDDKTGKKGLIPPGVSHPNCRCSIEYRK